jgi:hypothetical protein
VKFVPIKVIADEAEKIGFPLDPKSLLCGFVVGRNPALFDDEEKLRFQVRTILDNPYPPDLGSASKGDTA